MSVKVVLWGDLGDRFVPELELEVSTFREVVEGLFANFPDMKHYLLETNQLYSIVCSTPEWEVQLTEQHADFPIKNATLTITPVLEGSGVVGKLIGGLALVGIGIITGGTGLIMAGIAMGLQALFFGNPKAPGKEEDAQSNIISGGSFNTAEGNTIGIVCGRVIVTSPQVISFTLESEYKSL